MKLKTFLIFLLISVFINCADDSGNYFNPCEITPFPGVKGVTMSNFVIETFDEPDQKGYLIKAQITNENSETVSGEPSFVVKENGEVITFSTSNSSSTTCLNIEANSTCDFEFRMYRIKDQKIDKNIELLCFYYYDN